MTKLKRYAIPAALIIVVAAALVLINELTDLAFARDYAWLFIAAATFFGFWLAHLSGDSNTRDTGHEGTE